MRDRFSHFGTAVLMMCAVFTGCKKADVTANATDPQLTFSLLPDNPSFTFAATTTTKPTFTWYAGTANITNFRLNAKRGDVATVYTSGAISNADLFASTALTSAVSIPKGDYTAVKAVTVFTQTIAAPFPLVLSGTYVTDGSVSIPVEFDLNDNVEVSVGLGNIIADGNKDFTASLSLHLNSLLTGIAAADMSAATRTNGSILISKTVNTSLYNKIKGNMLICCAGLLTSAPK